MFPFPNPMTASGATLPNWLFNPSDKSAEVTVSGDQKTVTTASSGWGGIRGTISIPSGKRYFEVKVTGAVEESIGLAPSTTSLDIDPAEKPGEFTNACTYNQNGEIWAFGMEHYTGYATYGGSDVIGVAHDVAAAKAWFSKNGVWQNGNPDLGTGGALASGGGFPLFPVVYLRTSAYTIPYPLIYSPPSGFVVL